MACCCCCDCTRYNCHIEFESKPCFLDELKESNKSIKRLLYKLDDLSDSLNPKSVKNYYKEYHCCKNQFVKRKIDFELCEECEKLISSKKDSSDDSEDVNQIWSKLLENIQAYIVIDNELKEANKLKHADTQTAVEKVNEPEADPVISENSISHENHIEYHLAQLRLYFEIQGKHSLNALENLDKIKQDLNALHKFLTSE